MAICKCVYYPKFKQALLGASVATFFAGATAAGNLTDTVTEPEVESPKRISSDVSAFYLGLSGGYGSGGTDRFGLRTENGLFGIGDLDLTGSYGGIRGGWRGVLPAMGGRDYVYGVEIGYDFGSIDDSTSAQIGSATVDVGSEVSDVFSVRLRNGLTNRSGRVLYFVTVGYVQGDVTTTRDFTSGPIVLPFETSDRRKGFSASIGAEHRLSENWSITGEYEYVQFDSKDVDLGSVIPGSEFSTKSTPSYRGLRFGLNYKF